MTDACRSCGAPGVAGFLDLGPMPLADGLRRPDEDGEEPVFPLAVGFCSACTLVQLLDDVDPVSLFGERYLYCSSYSDAVEGHARDLAERLIAERRLDPGSLVVEIASNDGYLLRHFREAGIPVLGIDPAPLPAAAAESAGIRTLREFFDADLATRLCAQGRRADVIVANNVLAHTPDPNAFARGLELLLADDGIVSIECQYVRDLIDGCAFDTIYHEHFSYFSCTALDELLRRNGLVVLDVERLPFQGGSLRLTCGRTRARARLDGLLAGEAAAGLGRLEYYSTFAARVASVVEAVRECVVLLRGEGARLGAYGAAAKGTILLNAAGLDRETIDVVVDRNPLKQGLLVPGVGIPIRDPSVLLDQMPDYVLLLAWNLEAEVLEQQREYRRRGGRFILPIPWPRIV